MILEIVLPVRKYETLSADKQEIEYSSFYVECTKFPTKDELLQAISSKIQLEHLQFANYSQIKKIDHINQDMMYAIDTIDKISNPENDFSFGQTFKCNVENIGEDSGSIWIIEPIQISQKETEIA